MQNSEQQSLETRQHQSQLLAYILQSTINEYDIMQRQTDLLRQIEKKTISSKQYHNFSTEFSEHSFDSFDRSKKKLNGSISSISLSRSKSKRGDFDRECTTEDALNQIERQCSGNVLIFIKKRLLENQNCLQIERDNKKLVKQCSKMTQQIAEFKVKLEIMKSQEQKKKMASPSSTSNLEKSAVFVKWEKSLLYKEKIQAEIKKSLNNQINILEQEKLHNQSLRAEIKEIVEEISSSSNQNQELKGIIEVLNTSFQEKGVLETNQLHNYRSFQHNLDTIFEQLKAIIQKIG